MCPADVGLDCCILLKHQHTSKGIKFVRWAPPELLCQITVTAAINTTHDPGRMHIRAESVHKSALCMSPPLSIYHSPCGRPATARDSHVVFRGNIRPHVSERNNVPHRKPRWKRAHQPRTPVGMWFLARNGFTSPTLDPFSKICHARAMVIAPFGV